MIKFIRQIQHKISIVCGSRTSMHNSTDGHPDTISMVLVNFQFENQTSKKLERYFRFGIIPNFTDADCPGHTHMGGTSNRRCCVHGRVHVHNMSGARDLHNTAITDKEKALERLLELS